MPVKGNLSRLIKRHAGAAMTELLVSLPALLYDAKTTVNYATFEAARKGAVNYAQSDAML